MSRGVGIAENFPGNYRVGLHVKHANTRRTVDENILGKTLLVVRREAEVMEGSVDEGEGCEKNRHNYNYAGVHLKKTKKIKT